MNVLAESRYHNAIIIAEKTIKQDEGCVLKPYKDTMGKVTIGYGRCLDDTGISQDEAEYLFINDMLRVVDALRFMAFWSTLSSVRQAALINLAYCVGIYGFRQFKKMIAALEDEDYPKAAAEILDSKFAAQTGQRAHRLSVAMVEG